MFGGIVLASKSPFRAALLSNAGISFETAAAGIDERAVEAALEGSGASPDDVAAVLAAAKAEAVSEKMPEAIVIGCDQVLSLGDEVLHKCTDMVDARARLLQLAGKTHQLSSAVAVARGGNTLWRDVKIARLTMRALNPGFVGRHLARVGEAVLGSVGAYQYEGEGIQLFEAIDGDYFTIVGLPLLPLLDQLRAMSAIDG
jgi:septum formation protein